MNTSSESGFMDRANVLLSIVEKAAKHGGKLGHLASVAEAELHQMNKMVADEKAKIEAKAKAEADAKAVDPAKLDANTAELASAPKPAEDTISSDSRPTIADRRV